MPVFASAQVLMHDLDEEIAPIFITDDGMSDHNVCSGGVVRKNRRVDPTLVVYPGSAITIFTGSVVLLSISLFLKITGTPAPVQPADAHGQ